jgi:hypothetical protein
MTAAASMLLLGCSEDTPVDRTTEKLTAECVEDAGLLEETDWLCPNGLTLECEDGGANPEVIYLEPFGDLPESCEDIDLALNDEGPFELGAHEIVVTAEAMNGDDAVEETCTAMLDIVDTEPPEAIEEPTELWPPNHELHTISGEDCAKDACDSGLAVTFHSASSDEPVNDVGDGNTEPDIILECDRVQLRSERQGGGNGRVYTLGWTAVDDSGNETEGECIVTVPHDQSGREAVDDGPAYEVTLASEECDDGTGGAGGESGAGGVVAP